MLMPINPAKNEEHGERCVPQIFSYGLPVLNGYNDVLTVRELAKALRIGKNAAYALVRERAIPSVRIGRKYLVPKLKVVDFLSNPRYNKPVDS